MFACVYYSSIDRGILDDFHLTEEFVLQHVVGYPGMGLGHLLSDHIHNAIIIGVFGCF